MADKALKHAEDERDDLANKIAEFERLLPVYRERKAKAERFIADWYEYAGLEVPEKSDATDAKVLIARDDNSLAPRKRTRPKNPAKEHVAAVVCEIIRERGSPQMRADLFDALAKRGVAIQGKDPQMVLSTMLWRMGDVIVRLQGGGYWPAEDALPEGETLYLPRNKNDAQDVNSAADRNTQTNDEAMSDADIAWMERHDEMPHEHSDPE